jgi:hypothetical protein
VIGFCDVLFFKWIIFSIGSKVSADVSLQL